MAAPWRLLCISTIACGVLMQSTPGAPSRSRRPWRDNIPSQAEVPLWPTGDNSNAAVRPELDRQPGEEPGASDALTTVIPGLTAEAVDEQQELYADLGMDSLRFAQLLVELEGRLNVELVDEDLMMIELVNVADLIGLVEHLAFA